MRKLLTTLVAIMTLGSVSAGEPSSQTLLQVGDSAPELKVTKWLKGDPVRTFEDGKIYVIEFWSSWCIPCIAEMRHLSKLSVKYSGTVVVVGVNTLERKHSKTMDVIEVEKTVRKFVEDKGDEIGYRIAMDDPIKNTVYESWAVASGQKGLPSCVVVDQQGRIAWIGHPSKLNGPLEELVKGTFDRQSAVQEQRAQFERTQKYEKRMASMAPINEAIRCRDYQAARREALDLINRDPASEVAEFWTVLSAFLYADAQEALNYVERKSEDSTFLATKLPKSRLGDGAKDAFLENVAKYIVQLPDLPKQAYEFALARIELAIQQGPTYQREHALAQGYANLDNLDAAVAAEERALALVEKVEKTDSDADSVEMMATDIKVHLARYKEQRARGAQK